MKTKNFLITIALTTVYISPLFCRLSGPEIGSLRDQFNKIFDQPWSNENIKKCQNIIMRLEQGKATRLASELEAKLYESIFHAALEQFIPEQDRMKEENKQLQEAVNNLIIEKQASEQNRINLEKKCAKLEEEIAELGREHAALQEVHRELEEVHRELENEYKKIKKSKK